MENEVVVGTIKTPLGDFGAAFSAKGLGRLTFASEPLSHCEDWARQWLPQARHVQDDLRLEELAEQLNAYFTGDLRQFTIPLDMRGTLFQLEVWEALLEIGYGEIRSYGQIANQIGKPKAVRAVGAANGANPVPIIVPCHRVIGSGWNLTGYGGGLPLKERLLKLEGALLV